MIEKNFGEKFRNQVRVCRRTMHWAKKLRVKQSGRRSNGLSISSSARSLEAIWGAIAAADKYLTSEQPWAKGDSEADTQRKATILMDDRGIAAHRDGARASGFAGQHD